MKAVLNGRFLSRKITGVERYSQAVLACLGDRFRVLSPPNPIQGFRGHVWEQLVLPREIQPDEILWSPANTGPLSVSNQVVTIHDLSPFEHPEWFKPAFSTWYRLFLPVLIRKAKKILTPSHYVRKKVLARFALDPGRVIATSAGVDIQRFHPCDLPKEPYLLFVGTHEPRKNLLTLLQAWHVIRSRHPTYRLVVAGSPGSVFRPIRLTGDLDQVVLPGYIPEVDLPALVARAALLIMPSLDEGFGLPVLEAMACGTPVIASRAGALPEVVGEAGLLFDPNEPSALAAAMDQCLGDSNLLNMLRERGLERARQFSWQDTADRVWQALQS